MINDEQICELLKNEVPEIRKDFNGKGSKSCIAGLKSLTRYSAKLIEKGSIEVARKCFSLAEKLMENGSHRVKSALTVHFLMEICPLLKPGTIRTQPFKTLLHGHLLSQYRYSVNMDKW